MPGAVDPRLLHRARATRPYLVAGVLVGTATAFLIVAQAWLLATAVGAVVEGHGFAPVIAVLPPLAGVIAGRAVLTWLHAVIAVRTSAAVKSQLRADIMAARLRRPTATSLESGPLVALMTVGLDALDGYFARYLPQLVLATTVPIVVGVAIATTDLLSAATIAVTLPLIVVFMVLVGWMTKSRMARRWRVQSRLAHHFADLLGGLTTLQVFGRAGAQAQGLQATGEAHRRETMAILRVSFLSALVLELVATLSVALVAVGIGLRVVEGDLTLTVGLFVLMLAPEVYLPLRQVGVHYHDSVDGVAAADQAFTLIDAAGSSTMATPAVPVPDLGTARIDLVDVGVRCPGSTRWAVRHLDLSLAPGEMVALVGPSGAGKTTALNALMGFSACDEGEIRVGGVPLSRLDLDEWRARLGWVGQQPGLVPGTIGDNVRLGAPDASGAEIVDALAVAGAADLDPARMVLETGEDLSAGEVRRVALARAILRVDAGDGAVLLLDEPTAGLDSATELRVLEGLRDRGVTVLAVTHRTAVIAAADRIVSLEPPADDRLAHERAIAVGSGV